MDKPVFRLPDAASLTRAELSTLHGYLEHPAWPLIARYLSAAILEEGGILAEFGTTPQQADFLRGRIDGLNEFRAWCEKVVPAAYKNMLETEDPEKPKETP